MTEQLSRIFFIEMMGEPGSYDASVYDDFEDKDQEGLWFIKRYGDLPGISIETRNVCLGEALPDAGEADGIVLAGSYNSVYDQTTWQKATLDWFPKIRASKTPLLGICGSHQLLSYHYGVEVEHVKGGAFAGTMPVSITTEGVNSPLFKSVDPNPTFHFANGEHVINTPTGATLLATCEAVPVAALDFGDHWYTTQFHPEATAKSLSAVWKFKAPELCSHYNDDDAGDLVIINFLNLVRELGKT